MKKLLTYILIYAYAVALIKPVIPLVFDCIAHALYEFEHLAVVHEHHGTYHVDSELREAAEDLPQANSSDCKVDNNLAAHFASSLLYDFRFMPPAEKHSLFFATLLRDAIILKLGPPPKQCI